MREPAPRRKRLDDCSRPRLVLWSDREQKHDVRGHEFGVKVSIAVTNARAAGGQFVLGIQTMPGLPYDGHTLKDQIAQVERLTGEKVARVYVDKGYRGHGLAAPEIHVTQSPGQRSPTVKRELRRRAAVEPVIGYAKSDGLLERNRLAGARGDAINAVLARTTS